MSWMDLDDKILDHPKFIRAVKRGGGDTVFLWLGLRQWVAQNLTDGFIPDDMVEEARGPKGKPRTAALLILEDVHLVDREAGGIRLHDFLDWSDSRAQVMEKRRIAGVRSAMRASPELMAIIKERDGDRCRYCGVRVGWGDRRGPLGGTYDHVTPISKGGANEVDNIVVACRACNSRKQHHSDWNEKLLPVGHHKHTGLLPVGTTGHLSSPLLSTPLHTKSESSARTRGSGIQPVAPKLEPDEPEQEPIPPPTICPLNLTEVAEKVGIVRDFVERYHAEPAQIREVVREFVTYWTIGAGIGRRESNWPRKLRKHVQTRCEALGGLAAPGALKHAQRAPQRHRGASGGAPEMLSALIPSENTPSHQVWKEPEWMKNG